MISIPFKSHGVTLLVVWFVIYSSMSDAQVRNDGIQDRSELVLDADYIASSTHHNSVEWACVNKALTSKCIEYHNDQWFSFSVSLPGKYYLNVSSQACRDGRGIQALIIEGNPCEIKKYKVLQCVSQIRQQDVFIELDSVKANERYLVNIDGFLGDFCSFDIQLSSTKKGLDLNAKSLDTLEFSSRQSGKIVTLEWKVNQAIAHNLQGFEILRRFNSILKPVFLTHVPIEYNALGTEQRQYSIQDTLSIDGTYHYEILGVNDGGVKEIFTQQTVKFYLQNKPQPYLTLDVLLDYKKGTPILVLLIDKRSNKILKKYSFLFNRMIDSDQRILVDMYVAMGIRNFFVRCVNQKTFEEKNYEFEVTNDNEVLRK